MIKTSPIRLCPDHAVPDMVGCQHCEPIFRDLQRKLRRGELHGRDRRTAADYVLRYIAQDYASSLGGRLDGGRATSALREAARFFVNAETNASASSSRKRQ